MREKQRKGCKFGNDGLAAVCETPPFSFPPPLSRLELARVIVFYGGLILRNEDLDCDGTRHEKETEYGRSDKHTKC